MANLNRVTKMDRKTVEKICRAAYADHLHTGLTLKKNYGLAEAAHYWRAAKADIGEYGEVGFMDDTRGNMLMLIEYIEKHDEYVETLESFFRERGIDIDTITYDELEVLRALEEGGR